MVRMVVALVAWTIVVGSVLFLTPGMANAPGCASSVEPSATCLAEIAAMNDAIWRGQGLPILVLSFAGYAVIAVASFRRSRPG